MELFLGLAVPVQVALITAFIGSITIILNTLIGKWNLSSLKQRRYIDTIGKERIEWLNNIRDSFVEFTMITSELATFMSIYNLDDLTVVDEEGKEYFTKLINLNAVKHKINLLLNPTEIFSEKLTTSLDQIVDDLLENNGILKDEVKMKDFRELRLNIEFIQQVILKAEWRRIIKETESGKKLKKEDVEKVFIEVATDIDKDRYILLMGNEAMFH